MLTTDNPVTNLRRKIKLNYSLVTNPLIFQDVDQLLYDVLWKPHGLDREIRRQFSTGLAQYTFTAADDVNVLGCIIVCEHPDELELRHMAVACDFQNRGIGTKLLKFVLNYFKTNSDKKTMFVYARNKALDFYMRQGFYPIDDEWLEIPGVVMKGVRFKRLIVKL